MAKRKLGLEIDLGHRSIKLGQEKEGIVAKATGPPWRFKDEALDGAVGRM